MQLWQKKVFLVCYSNLLFVPSKFVIQEKHNLLLQIREKKILFIKLD